MMLDQLMAAKRYRKPRAEHVEVAQPDPEAMVVALRRIAHGIRCDKQGINLVSGKTMCCAELRAIAKRALATPAPIEVEWKAQA